MGLGFPVRLGVITAFLFVYVHTLDSAQFRFRDVTEESGMVEALQGIRGHAAGWGDTDGDGWADLYVGSFDTRGSRPNVWLSNR